MKIIIADDSLTMRRVLCNMLSGMGEGGSVPAPAFDCLLADGGDVVLELLDEHPDVGLILLDWNMNVMNGLDCLRAIRARPGMEKVPVVMITVESMDHRIVEALRAGANNYLIKPFTPEKFNATIAPLIAGRTAGRK